MTTSQTKFQPTVSRTIGTLTGVYLWSNVDTRSAGLPATGESIGEGGISYHDIASRTIEDLFLINGGTVEVTGGIPSVATVSVSGSQYGEQLSANAEVVGAPVTASVGTILNTGGAFGGIGAGALLIDHSPTDVGGAFIAEFGGCVEITARPAATSVFGRDAGTIALATPVPIQRRAS